MNTILVVEDEMASREMLGQGLRKRGYDSLGSFRHRARSWPHQRRICYKAEHSAAGTNLRFVVTNCPRPRGNLRLLQRSRRVREPHRRIQKRFPRPPAASAHRAAHAPFDAGRGGLRPSPASDDGAYRRRARAADRRRR